MGYGMRTEDTRVLPDGTTVDRNDPRFYDVGLDSNGQSDEWLRRVRASVAGLRAGYASANPQTTNMAVRPNVAGVRTALNIPGAPMVPAAAGASPLGGTRPAGGGTGIPGIVPGQPVGTIARTAPGTGITTGTTTNAIGRPADTTATPVTPAPTTGGMAPGYGTGDNPAWGTFLGSALGGSAVVLTDEDRARMAAGSETLWDPLNQNHAKNVGLESTKVAGAPPIPVASQPAPAPITSTAPVGTNVGLQAYTQRERQYANMLADGGRVGRRRRRKPITIQGTAVAADGDGDMALADGGRIPFAEYQRRNQMPDSYFQDSGSARSPLRFDEAAWNALPVVEQYRNVGTDNMRSVAGHSLMINGIQDANGLVTTADRPDPRFVAPGKVKDNGDGTFTYNPDDIDGAALAQEQQRQDDSGLGDSTHFAIAGIGTVLGGAAIGAAMGAGEAGAGLGAAEAGGDAFAGAAAGGELSGGAGLGTEVGLGSGAEAFGGAAGEGFGGAGMTPEALATNPAVQNAFQGALASGEVSAGTSITSWLSNPRNLLNAARLIGTVATSLGSGSSGAQVPSVGDPGAGAPGSGAPGAANPLIAAGAAGGADSTFDWERYFSDNPTANWESARSQFQPITAHILDEAENAGSAAEQEAAAGRASADVAQRFASSKAARERAMISQGINPSDPRGVGGELDRLSTLDRARAEVGGENAARIAEKNRGFAMRTSAANLGTAQAGQALTADNVGLQSASTRARLGTDVANQNANRRYQYTALGQTGDIARSDQEIRRALANNTIAGGNATRNAADRTAAGVGLESIYRYGSGLLGSGGNSYRDAGLGDDNYWTMFNKDGGRIDAKKAGKARISRNYRDGARVTVARKDFDAGGEVVGPGTSTSDSVRAQVSDGEHVLNAEATELMDAEMPGALDEMNQKGLMIRAVRAKLRAGINDVGLGD